MLICLSLDLLEADGSDEALSFRDVGLLRVFLRHALFAAPRLEFGLASQVKHAGFVCKQGNGILKNGNTEVFEVLKRFCREIFGFHF